MTALANHHKKTRVPLAGISTHGQGGALGKRGGPGGGASSAIQIVLRHIGTEKERFGSVSFTLKRFHKAQTNAYLHWVTLYDSLDDDLFEGQLGEDDDFDYPRILLDYQIISSKFTSMINQSEKLGQDATLAALNQRKLVEQREDSTSESKKKAKVVKLTNVSQTLEFSECRADKMSGLRKPFKAYVFSD